MTAASATMGIPNPPKATGAVFATRQTVAASQALNPRPSSRKAATATGAPKPAVPSSSAPKQKATRITWIRASPEACSAIQSRSRSNFPVSTERLYSHSAAKTIHMMGQSP